MRKSSTIRPRSSSQPGRFSQNEERRNSLRMESRRLQASKLDKNDSMIPKPRVRTSSTDRLSIRKWPATGPKTSISAMSPMPNSRYTLDKPGRQSNIESKGYTTPKSKGNSRPAPSSEGKSARSSSAERGNSVVAMNPKKDIRPLNDKNYQNEMLSKIDNYLHSINEISFLNSNASIKPLGIKIFVEITNILVTRLEKRMSVNSQNYLEEIPKIAKKLHYPGSVNKSWLKTANALHSWHNSLGWLCWLVELCQVKDIANEIFTLDKLPVIGDTLEKQERLRRTFNAMIRSYQAWNDENAQKEEEILDQFFKEETKQRGISEEVYNNVETDLKKVQNNLHLEQQKLEKMSIDLQQDQEIAENLKKDLATQHQHMEQKVKYVEKLIKEAEQLEKESLQLEDDIQKLEATKEELSEMIKQQPMSVSERDAIVETCGRQQNYIQNFEAHLEEIKKESFSLDMKLTSSNKNLTSTILGYNQNLFMQLNEDTNGQVDKLLMPEDGHCQPDFMNRLEEKMNLMNKFLEKQTQKLNEKINLLESQNLALQTLQAKRDILSEKAQKKKASEEKRKEDFKAQENKKREQVKVLQLEIEDMGLCVQKKLQELESLNQELEASKLKTEEVTLRIKKTEECAIRFFQKMEAILNPYRQKLKDTLEKTLEE